MSLYGLRVILRGLMLPPAGPLLIGIVGLLMRRRPRLGFSLCAVSIIGLWLLSIPLIADTLGRAAEGYPAVAPADLPALRNEAGAIVVLGGGFRFNAPEAGGDAPSPVADLRLIEAARVARATQLPVLVTGNGLEAAVMERFMEETMQVPVRWVENHSGTTRQNAEFSARILRPLGIERIILVTTGTHMIRAVGDFKSAGFSVIPVPADMVTRDEPGVLVFVPSVEALSRSQSALYEFAGRFVHMFI